MNELWHKTQDPELHEQWDLRFSDISYLPKATPDAPQHFLYQTQLGLGVAVKGEGKSLATHEDANGKRTSSLKFWSDAPISLIRSGAGYWQYVPDKGAVHFVTRYDYETRFGWLGHWIDRLCFRPLMAYATAWSFDRLRLWVERGQSPQRSIGYVLGITLAWCALLVAWVIAAGEMNALRVLFLFFATFAVLSLHLYLEPLLPSANRCRWSWR
jgi:hypothetical protein